jgi:hypothetical protein
MSLALSLILGCSTAADPAEVAVFGPAVWLPSAEILAFCDGFEDQPCATEHVVGECSALIGVIDRGAGAVGCGEAFRGAFGCMSEHLACPPEGVTYDLAAAMTDSSPYCAQESRASFDCLATACVPEAPVCQAQGSGCAVQVAGSCGTSGALCAAADGFWSCECAGAPGGRHFELHTESCCDGTDWVLGACAPQLN